MKTTQEDKIPPMKPHQWNSYRYTLSRFYKHHFISSKACH